MSLDSPERSDEGVETLPLSALEARGEMPPDIASFERRLSPLGFRFAAQWPGGGFSFAYRGDRVPEGKVIYLCIDYAGPKFNLNFYSQPDDHLHEFICSVARADLEDVVGRYLDRGCMRA